MAGARLAALNALEKCRRAGAWSDAVLGSVMDNAGLDGRDRALASAICYGVMQNMLLLDYYIGCYCSMKTSKLEPKVLDILRISAYQIIFMDRIPPSAAVNEGVKLSRQLGYARAAGLVNAVLRRVSEHQDALPPVKGESALEELSIQYSCPMWLTEYIVKMLGKDEAIKLLCCQNSPVPVTVQANTCKIGANELLRSLNARDGGASLHPYLPDCILLRAAGEISSLPEFKDGLFYVQDAAAKLSVLAAGPKAGDRVLDVCSAPGGKSFAASVISGGGAQIISCDIHENKLKRIRDGAARLGFEHIRTFAADGRIFRHEWESSFDIVIADVPCSGLGVIRKKPDIRYKEPADFGALPEIQSAILNNAARYVRPGGVLLYSTCTFRREENSAVVNAFLKSAPVFCTEDFALPRNICSDGGMMQLWPQRHGTDGFFIAKLRRNI